VYKGYGTNFTNCIYTFEDQKLYKGDSNSTFDELLSSDTPFDFQTVLTLLLLNLN
jgi:hypothetical protein